MINGMVNSTLSSDNHKNNKIDRNLLENKEGFKKLIKKLKSQGKIKKAFKLTFDYMNLYES